MRTTQTSSSVQGELSGKMERGDPELEVRILSEAAFSLYQQVKGRGGIRRAPSSAM